MELITSVIKDIYTIGKAQTLLYEYYIEKLKWDVPPNNDSGIKIKKTNQYHQFVDDYDPYSTWFSVANKKNAVIACARLCKEDADGLLEIERYHQAKQRLHTVLSAKKELNLIELNREAILPGCPDNKVASLLLLDCIFNYCQTHGYSVLTTTNIPEWLALYDSLPFTKLDDCQFRYAETDPKPVEVYFIEHKNLKSLLAKINLYLKNSYFYQANSGKIEPNHESVQIKK